MVTKIGDQAFAYNFKQVQEICWQAKFSNGRIKVCLQYTH